MPFYGRAMLCVDSPPARDILAAGGRPVTTYGMSEEAQVRALNVRADYGQMRSDSAQYRVDERA